MRLLLILFMTMSVGLSVSCQKKSTSKTKSAAPTDPGSGGGGGGGGDECTGNTNLLLNANAQQPKLDAFRLVADVPNIVGQEYAEILETMLISFEAPFSETSQKYYPNYGKIEVFDESNNLILTKETGSYSNEIAVPAKYHGETLKVRVHSCADPSRVESGEVCGEKYSESRVVLPQITHPKGTELNETLMNIMLAEDKMQELCLKFKNVSDQFLAIDPQPDGTEDEIAHQAGLRSFAEMASLDSYTFMTMCSSHMLDEVFELRQDVRNDQASSGVGLFITNESCNSVGGTTGTGTGTETTGKTIEDEERECNARDGFKWDSGTNQCGVDEDKLASDCSAKSTDDATFKYEDGICTETKVATEEVSGEADCIKAQGVWSADNNLCSLKLTQVSSFNGQRAQIKIGNQCLVKGESNSSIASEDCKGANDYQLFSFSETDDDKVLIKNTSGDPEAETCLKLGEKDGDTYPIVTVSCGEAGELGQFQLVDATFDGTTYRTFKSTTKDDDGNYFCIQKGSIGVEAAVCTDISVKDDNKEPQLFLLDFYEEPAESTIELKDHEEIVDRSSLVAEGGDEAGKDCIAVESDGGALKLETCDASSDKQKFDSRGTGKLQASVKLNGDDTSTNLCLDYTDVTDVSSSDKGETTALNGAKCSDDSSQRLKLSETTVLFNGEEQTFQFITRNDGQAADSCLQVKGSQLIFADCLYRTNNTYEGLKSQLFTVVKGGGAREEYGNNQRGWFDDPPNPFSRGSQDAWLYGVTAGLIAAGTGLIAHAVAPEFIEKSAKAIGAVPGSAWTWARQKNFRMQISGHTAFASRAEMGTFKEGGFKITKGEGNKVTLTSNTGIEYPATFDRYGKANFKDVQIQPAGVNGKVPPVKNIDFEVLDKRKSLFPTRAKGDNRISAGGSWARGALGAVLLGAGIYFAASSPGAGLVQSPTAAPDCIALDTKGFSELSQEAAFDKFFCEEGRLLFELAEFHRDRADFQERVDKILEDRAKEIEEGN